MSKADDIIGGLESTNTALQNADSFTHQISQEVTDLMALAEELGQENAIQLAAVIGEENDKLIALVQQAMNQVLDVTMAVNAFRAGG